MQFKKIKKEIDEALDKNLPRHKDVLSRAMRYSVLGRGKRLRPILVIATARMLGAEKKDAILPACAIELIHNFTLIHDDLPCMDNDDFRRGKPALHKAYNEAIALLTGDALLNLAFDMLVSNNGARAKLDPFIKVKMVKEISSAIGADGLVRGQVEEISSRKKKFTLPVIEDIYAKKTARLICAAVRIGAMIGKADQKEFSLLTNYGRNLGIAFQISDDILEFINGDSENKKDEPNYVFATSLEKAEKTAREKIGSAKKELAYFGRRARLLLKIADYIVARGH